jgi:hypothetical protein
MFWAILATPETALADKPDNPGGNIVKQDIPGVLTLDDLPAGGLKSDGALAEPVLYPAPYSNLEAGTTCFIGRRRSIWVSLSKNSPRSMSLDLGTLSADGPVDKGDDPWGDPVMNPEDFQLLDLPNGHIYEVYLHIAHFVNVSGLETGELLEATTKLHFLDSEGNQWGLYFGTAADWGGGRQFTSPDAGIAGYVEIDCVEQYVEWKVTSVVPGFLWFAGSKKNAPWVYVGKCNVAWSCTVNALP